LSGIIRVEFEAARRMTADRGCGSEGFRAAPEDLVLAATVIFWLKK